MSRTLEILFRLLPTIAVLGLAELTLRALDLPTFDACWVRKEEFWEAEPDPELGWRYRPGSYVAKATINENGWRGPVLPPEKSPDALRILFLGDSTAFGVGMPLEDSFAYRAVQGIQADFPERKVEYELAALPGYSSYHSRILLRRKLPLSPDLVVLYVGAHNDHSRGRYYADGDIADRLARRHAAWHGWRLLRVAENTWDVLYRKFFRKLRSDADKARVPPETFRANVRDMLEATRAGGARALVLLPPFSDYLLEDHPIIPLYQDALRDLAAEFGAPTVDLQETFVQHPEEEVYLEDLFHFREKGHALAAERIREAVARLLLRGG